MTLLYLFRKRNSGFSIEGLFTQLAAYIADRGHHSVNLAFVPHMKLSPRRIWTNLRYARRQQADIYHITGDVHYLMLVLPPARTVLTIHDCVSLERQAKAGNRVRFWLLWLLFYYLPMRRARYVTTVSEKSRQELVRFMGIKMADKVRVIPNYINPRFKPSVGTFNEQCPTVLQVGTHTHKNLLRLIDALSGFSCRLVIIGSLSQQQQACLSNSGIHYEVKERLTDNEMVTEYKRCDIVAFVSTYEGFGLPILEANAVGRPIIASAISPLREIANEAACLVDPYSVEAIRTGLHRIILDFTYRTQLIQAGFINAERYTIKQVAERYEAIYQEILT